MTGGTLVFNPKTEPWPVMILMDEFDQLGKMPIVVQSLKQLAGHGGRVSIITQSIPGLDKIYEENDRLSIESAAGMKLFLSPNEKKTAAEVSEALGKTTRLSLSDSYSSDGKGLRRRSVSRRNEERPLLTPDEVKKLDPTKVILIPERQHPILADRIVYFNDPYFMKIMEAQQGRPLPYPDERHEMQAMRQQIEQLQSRVEQFQPLAYEAISGQEPERQPARKVVQEVLAAVPVMSDEEAREAIRPSDKDKISRASAFHENLKRKLKQVLICLSWMGPARTSVRAIPVLAHKFRQGRSGINTQTNTHKTITNNRCYGTISGARSLWARSRWCIVEGGRKPYLGDRRTSAMHIEKHTDVERWLRPAGPKDRPDPGYDEWLAAEIEAGLAELDSGNGLPAEEVWKALGLE